ncbi:DUF5959 family protein [Streptomyces microflavus]|uniref:DUF5959 family protein n=1 Tax=Streptomyces microflavus TaxID=1919 RepID=UPI0038151AC2
MAEPFVINMFWDGVMDLIQFSDGDTSVRVSVLGRQGPGILPVHDLLDAEILVNSSFISGRLDICFHLSDLESWSTALDDLEIGRSVEWLDTGNGPVIRIQSADDDSDVPVFVVEDASGSGASAIIPIAVGGGWIERQREQLREVMRMWPSEVVKTSPGAYEWRS